MFMSDGKVSLIAKLKELEARYDEIEKQIADPQIAGDTTKIISLSKEQAKLKKIVLKYREYKKAENSIIESNQLIADESVEEDLKELAWEEIKQQVRVWFTQ